MQQMKILIADDDPTSLLLLKSVAERCGYQPISAVNGAQAYDKLISEQPLIAIIDWMMPEIDGVQLCRNIRAVPDIFQPYLIILTARDGKDDIVEGFTSGADDYVTKPFDIIELRARISAGRRVVELQRMLTEKIDELSTSEEKYRRIYESIHDVYYEAAVDGTILEVSPSAVKILLYKRSELIGMNMGLIYENPDELDEVKGELLTKNGFIKNHHVTLKDKDGRLVYCSITAELIRDETGSPFKIFGTLRDITELKESENEKRILEEQVNHMRRLEVIGRLAGGVAHDFNNILGGINGYADLLVWKLQDDPKGKRYAEQIIISAQRGSSLTSQLLSFARKGSFEINDIDINKIVARLRELLENTLAKDFILDISLYSSPCIVHGDASQLESALMNLAINARDAMERGGLIRIETAMVDIDQDTFVKEMPFSVNSGRYVKVSVHDTGCGMDKSVKARLFEPYFTTKAVGKGTGLGLAGVYGCVKQHKGYVDVWSEPGKGTKVDLYLPFVEQK